MSDPRPLSIGLIVTPVRENVVARPVDGAIEFIHPGEKLKIEALGDGFAICARALDGVLLQVLSCDLRALPDVPFPAAWVSGYEAGKRHAESSSPKYTGGMGSGFTDADAREAYRAGYEQGWYDFIPCEKCLQNHDSAESCKCAKCGCGVHGLFLVCAKVDGKPNVLCPTCHELSIKSAQ